MRSSSGTLIVGAVVALAVGLGLGALLFGSGGGSKQSSTADSSSSSSGTSGARTADTRAISLPASLGGFRDVVDVTAEKGVKASIITHRRQTETTVAAATRAAYSHAYGGAAAAYRAYGDSALAKMPYVIAVVRRRRG